MLCTTSGDERIAGDAIASSVSEYIPGETERKHVVTKDGDVRHVEFNVRLITYEGENAQLGSAREVTERKQRKQGLKQQNERLEEFASVISHDLRNFLNVAQGHLEFARERGGEQHFDKS